jgi:GntR family transcriptional repressor for pyruvate dehydrogenase complex
MEGFRRIRNDRLSDKAVQQLVQHIRAGELPVGTRLPSESELAVQLGVSRGILREALTILQMQGYISRAPRSGTIVQSTSGNETGNSFMALVRSCEHKSLIEFREAVECRAVRSVIRTASQKDIGSLFNLLDTPLSFPEQRPDYYFHYRLAEISGNPLICAFIDLYYDTIREKAIYLTNNPKVLQIMMQEHVKIAEAIRDRDLKSAVAAMRSHLHRVEKNTFSP